MRGLCASYLAVQQRVDNTRHLGIWDLGFGIWDWRVTLSRRPQITTNPQSGPYNRDELALPPGTRLGSYEVIAQIGEGGMGQVYRARDTKLHRDVALKILPDPVASDPDRLARFTREAHTLASLNHSNIAHIHGLEESGGVRALVMELVEGEDLSQRVARGAIPIDEALPIARQIAEALEAAHEQGIIHRDLKPANVMVRADGTVKVLDFGLAKALDPARAVDAAPLADSPTVLSPAVTRTGVILGTAAYMSPEQAKGRVLDKRADVWAFGCVFYEMLTGSRAFDGEHVQDILASVLARGPDWRKLPEATPVVIERLLRRCLEKDPAKRLRDIGDARLEITDAMAAVPEPSHTQSQVREPRRLTAWRAGAAGIVIGVTVASLTFAIARRLPTAAPPHNVQRLSLTFPATASLSKSLPHFALSADDNAVVYVGESARIYVRALNEEEPRALPGTEGAWNPFFSPDGEWIGYVDAGKSGGAFLVRPGQLKKMSVRGSAPVVLADAVALGASWGRDDTIVFSRQTDHGVALFTIAASGGAARQLTTPANDRIRVGWPSRLPDGNTLLFSETDGPTFESGRTVALLLRTGERRTVLEQGYAARYVESGHLVYVLDGSIMAIRFDPDRMQTAGAPVRVVSAVKTQRMNGWVAMSVATTGSLLYDPGLQTSERSLEWVTRERAEAPVVNDRREYSYPRLSPDGRRLAVGVGADIWILDLARGTRVRIPAADRGTSPPPPITAWTADGRRLAISRRNAPEGRIDLVDPDDVEHATPLVRRPYLVQLGSWSKNGTLAFFQLPGGSERDVWVLDPGASEPRPFLASRFNERGATFSPDGRWLAYAADPTGRDEVYVRPYPGPGPQVPVSTDGGVEPTWSRSGHEIFYRQGDRMMAVSFGSGPTASLGRPRILFEQPYEASDLGVANYDVAPDERFVVVRSTNTVRDNMLTVVLNWQEDLKRLVPAK